MDYPKFSGQDTQCYMVWEEKMQYALWTNRVPAVDKVTKIRQHLSGHPLLMVPDSVKLAKSAFDTLK